MSKFLLFNALNILVVQQIAFRHLLFKTIATTIKYLKSRNSFKILDLLQGNIFLK